MGFKTFAPGVLTSSDVNTFLMRQSVITCTSSTRPASPNEGMFIYETDTDAFVFYTGTIWQSIGRYSPFTPVIAASSTGWAFGNSTVSGSFGRVDKYIVGRMRVAWGSTATYGTTNLLFNLPVNGANQSEEIMGNGLCVDASAGNTYQTTVARNLQTFAPNAFATSDGRGNYSTVNAVINTIPMTWASGDILGFSFAYEAV